MPRISLYRPEKGHDYKFIDRQIREMFIVGGTDVYLHKYLGPQNTPVDQATADQPHYDVLKETNIQDLLFLENRDRKYSEDIYRIRGHYQVQDIDFNLSQFGLFLDNDMVYMTVHINDFVTIIGRKPIAGDVLELPHLRDQFALNDRDTAMPRFFVVEDVNRAAEGFSQTWWPHLYRLKLKKISDTQQYADILKRPTDQDANYVGDYDDDRTYNPGEIIRYQGILYTVTATTTGNTPPNTSYFGVYSGNTIQDLLSTFDKNIEINDAILAQAEADAPKSGYDTSKFYTLQRTDDGTAEIASTDATAVTVDAATQATDEDGNLLYDTNGDPVYVGQTASSVLMPADGDGYNGYLTRDGVPPNGAPFTAGIAFPINPTLGQFALRTDYLPNRLFRFDGSRWRKFEDNVRMTMNNLGASDVAAGDTYAGKDIRQTQKATFVNNTTVTTIDGHETKEKQSLTKALRPQADE